MSSLSTGPTDIGYTYHGRKRRWLQTGAVKAAKGVKPYSAKKEACKAETLVPFKNAVTGERQVQHQHRRTELITENADLLPALAPGLR